jgi:hypothetical protein
MKDTNISAVGDMIASTNSASVFFDPSLVSPTGPYTHGPQIAAQICITY